MKLLLRVSFWFTLFAIYICLFNYLGHDSKNIKLYLASPPFWILNSWLTRNFASTKYLGLSIEARAIIYTTTILFWLILGTIIDRVVKAIKNS